MLGGYLNGQLHTTGNIVGGFMFEAAVQGDILINHVEGGVVNNLGSQNGTVFEIGAAVTGAMIVTGAWQNLILRGRGLRVDVRLAPTFNPAIQMLGVSDSLITATFVTGGGGTQAYTIDAASARNLIIASGLHNAAFVVASTNAGSTCLVIDELGSSTGLWGADPRKDMVPGELFSPQTGVTTIPAAIGGAPSGPAGGALSGTYPNPNFAGRDSSVDALNKDMLPGSNLGLAEGPMGVQVYGHASESALSQTTDLSGVWPYFQVTGLSGKKVSATAPGDGDILNYVTGFNVGWINSTRESSSLATKDFAKDFMLMGG